MKNNSKSKCKKCEVLTIELHAGLCVKCYKEIRKSFPFIIKRNKETNK